MPNKPAKDTEGIYIRVHKDIKAAIIADIERINDEVPGSNLSISGWIRGAIDMRLKEAKKGRKNK